MMGIYTRFHAGVLAGVFTVLTACGGGEPNNGELKLDDPNTSCATPKDQPFAEDISSPITVPRDCYNIVDDVIIREGGSLVIAPGTVFRFSSSASITVFGGSMIAAGTSKNAILFTGQQDIEGFWQGIRLIYHSGQGSRISNSIIRYAGGEPFLEPYLDNFSASAALVLHSREEPNIQNVGQMVVTSVSIEKSAGFGLIMTEKSLVNAFSSSVITESEFGPALVHVSKVHMLDSSNTFTRNGKNIITIYGDQLGNTNPLEGFQNYNWPRHENTDYLISEYLKIYAPLTLNPGTTLYFAKDTGLSVYENDRGSYLKAIGTASNPITFTSDGQPFKGRWLGLAFLSVQSNLNRLENVRIEYAGGSRISLNPGAALYMENNLPSSTSAIVMKNTRISDSGGYGFYLKNNTSFSEFDNNTIINNDNAAGALPLKQLSSLDPSSNYGGGPDDHIRVTSSGVETEDVVQFPAINVPYHIPTNLNIRGRVFVKAGATIKMAKERVILVEGINSTLQIEGTSQRKVLLTSYEENPEPGFFNQPYWTGIIIKDSVQSNVITHANIEYAGSQVGTRLRTPDSQYVGVAVFVYGSNDTSSSELTINNTTITSTQGNYDLWSDPVSEVFESANTYSRATCIQCEIF